MLAKAKRNVANGQIAERVRMSHLSRDNKFRGARQSIWNDEFLSDVSVSPSDKISFTRGVRNRILHIWIFEIMAAERREITAMTKLFKIVR